MKLAVAFCPFTNLSEYAPYPFMGDLKNCIEKAKAYDFSGIELSIRTPNDIDIKECETLLAKSGLSISAIATGQNFTKDGLCFVSPEKPVRDEVVSRIKTNIDFAAQYGADVIIGGVRGSTAAAMGAAKDEILERVRECMVQLLEHAEMRNVVLQFEAINRYEIACGKSLEDTAEIIRSFNHPNLKLLADTYHMNIEETSFYDSIINTADVLGYMHLCDNNRMAAGLGRLDFTPIFKALTDIGYTGYLCAEVLPIPDSESVLKSTKDVFHAYSSLFKV